MTMPDSDLCLLDVVNTITSTRPDDEDDESLNVLLDSPYHTLEELSAVVTNGPDFFKILSTNIQCLSSKIDELKVFLVSAQQSGVFFDAICCQESWLDQDSDLSLLQLPGYAMISKGFSVSSHGGLVTYLREDLHYSILDFTHHFNSDFWEQLTLKISGFGNDESLVLGNIYRQPQDLSRRKITFLEDFDKYLGSLQTMGQVVIAGDYNVDLLRLVEKSFPEDLFDLSGSHGFFPRITRPTRITEKSKTLIDNFFCNFTEKIISSKAGILHQKFSDHQPYYLCVKMKQKNKKKSKFIEVRKPVYNAMKKMKTALSQFNFGELLSNVKEDPMYSFTVFQNIITGIYDSHFPLVKVRAKKYNHKRNKWITFGLINSMKFRDNLHKEINEMDPNNPKLPELQNQYKNFNKVLKRAIKAAKKDYYDDCFQKHRTDLRKTWTTLNEVLNRGKKSSSVPEKIIIDGKSVTSAVEIANEFNRYFTEIGPTLASQIIQPQANFADYLGTKHLFNFDFRPVDVLEISLFINQLNPKNSSGWDGISTNTLKEISDTIVEPLTEIINSCLIHNIFPNEMKIALVKPLFKKGDKTQLGNYRPISLLTAFSKVFEKVIFTQLQDFFNSNGLLSNNQYGFRKNHSTDFAACELVDRILQCFDTKRSQHFFSLFIDMSKAFDTLVHEILLRKLSHYGLSRHAVALIDSYLNDRTQFVKIGPNKSNTCAIKTGVPQGSILGPFLFLIYINDMRNACQILETLHYADDSTLYCNIEKTFGEASDIEISRRINDDLQNVFTWLSCNKLSLNIVKTKFMVFERPRAKSKNLEIILRNTKIDRITKFNFLGLNLASDLSWDDQIKHIKLKLVKTVGIMNRVKFLLSSEILLKIYNSLFLPYINLHILSWGVDKKALSSLEMIQKRAVRIISKKHFLYHSEPLLRNLGLLKIGDIYKVQLLKFYYKFENGKLPFYFSGFSFMTNYDVSGRRLRHSESKLYPPSCFNNFGHKKLNNVLIEFLNSVQITVKEKVYTHSLDGISKYFKKILIDYYQENCIIINCFPCRLNN